MAASAASSSKMGTLWIGDLDPNMDETFLKHAFTLMGENLINGKVIRSRYTGQTMGYGFLDFGDEATALRVLHRCNGKLIPNASPPKRFKLNHASYGKEQMMQNEFSLFVGDLTPEVDDLELYQAFSARYSSVKAAKVVLDNDGVSKGYGFVRFMNETECQTALVEVQNTMIVGSKPVRVSVATPKRGVNAPSASSTPPMTIVTTTVSASPTTNVDTSSQPASTTDYQAYYQYPAGYDYQNYYAAWQGYQQQYYNTYGYNYQGYDYSQQQTQQGYDASYDLSDNVIEEHDLPLDVEQMNADTIARNEEFYIALDTSRWLPTEGLDPPLVPVK